MTGSCLECGAALEQNPRGARRLRCPGCAKRRNAALAKERERLWRRSVARKFGRFGRQKLT
jgi:DNA-directed RNA polymerase subunit RPC12/RpoP